MTLVVLKKTYKRISIRKEVLALSIHESIGKLTFKDLFSVLKDFPISAEGVVSELPQVNLVIVEQVPALLG
jgi:hypothetical protein